MKFTHLKFLFILGMLSFLVSCGDDEDKKKDDDGNEELAEYYIQFKAAGTLKTFQTDEPGYQSCGDCACSTIPPFDSDYADVTVCNDENDWITAEDIEEWENMTINFDSGLPLASFYYVEDDIVYYSELAEDQSGTVTITHVEADGNFGGLLAYKVTGTFMCKVRSDEGTTDIAITEGKFVVRYSED
jgi:hypothetical protein